MFGVVAAVATVAAVAVAAVAAVANRKNNAQWMLLLLLFRSLFTAKQWPTASCQYQKLSKLVLDCLARL